ncbi:hypothetical protein [Streptomyces fradiae]|uniref:hypothetical protein n=1 Tax=Streptomyces fradiae TaxID=1906 RepID=UPI003666BC83
MGGNTFGDRAAVQGQGIQNFYYPPPPPRRRRTGLVVAGVLSVVLAAAGALLVLKLTGGSGLAGARGEGAATTSSPGGGQSVVPRSHGSPSPDGLPAAPDGLSSPRTSPPADSPPPDDPSGGAAERERWSGTLRIGGADGPQLDQEPPVKVQFMRDLWLVEADPPVLHGSDMGGPYGSNLALWDRPEAPTRKECAERVSTQGVDEVVVGRGSVVCVRTLYGRTAVLTVESVGGDARTGITVRARVWSATDNPLYGVPGGGFS